MVINTLQYDARYTQSHINTLQYDARYTQSHINTLQYDARYTQRHINTLQCEIFNFIKQRTIWLTIFTFGLAKRSKKNGITQTASYRY